MSGRGLGACNGDIFDGHVAGTPSALRIAARPGVIDEDAPHDVRAHRKEVRTIVPARTLLHRSGDKGLLSYNVSKAPELSNAMDPSSAPTGNTCFILSEVYETEAGVADHFKQAGESWKDFPALGQWLGKCKVTAVPAARSQLTLVSDSRR